MTPGSRPDLAGRPPDGGVPPPAGPLDPDPTLQGTETILVVENERPVRELIFDVLRLHGYTVLAAEDGPRALQVAADYLGPIDLAVIDVVMPGMTGEAVARQLTRARPGLKILYASGYTDQEVRGLGLPPGCPNFLQKPFTVDGLARKVREVLGWRAAGPVSG